MDVTEDEPPTVDRSASMSQSEEEQESKSAEPVTEPVTEPVSAEAPVVSPAHTSPAPPTAPATATGDKKEGKSSSPKPAEADAMSATEAVDFAPTAKTPSPSPNERPSVERLEPPPMREQSTDSASATASQIDPNELEAETRKRKRRSPSPDIPLQDIRAKKHRPSDSVAPEVHLKEDDDVVMEQRRPEEVEAVSEDKDTETAKSGLAEDEMKVDVKESDFTGPTTDASNVNELPEPQEKETTVSERKSKDARFKDIFKPAVSEPTPTGPPPEDDFDSGPVAPALHAATPGLYIRDLMRPLRIETLRAHLISLATPPSAASDPEVLKQLFVDSMKTHALVLFSNTNAASRVRATLHDTVWPPEGQRKPLFVDFVPADKILDWIHEEEEHISAEKEGRASGRSIDAKRFEIVYPTNPSTGVVEAVFQEVGARRPSFNPPKGPRSNIEQRRGSTQYPAQAPQVSGANREPAAIKPARDLGRSFQTLDQLFDSTTAKPKLYYLPVSDRIADRRLDDLDAETARDWRPEERVRGRGAGASLANQKMRYSFDDDDRVVQVGGDFGPWADDSAPPGGGGYRGGYRGGRGGGGFRSDFAPRGGYGGGGYRGRGGGGFRS